MLIDINGKIVFLDEPWRRENIEKDIDDLLTGKKIIFPEKAKANEGIEGIEITQT
jgi:hypothetical protein